MSLIRDKVNDLQSSVESGVDEQLLQLTSASVPQNCVSGATKEIFNAITDSEAFQNAKDSVISGVKNSSANMQSELETVTSGMLPSGWSLSDIDDVMNKLIDFDGIMDFFKSHTDRLSGVSFSTGITDELPDMNALMGVANQHQRLLACTGLDFPDTKDDAKNLFGGLVMDNDYFDADSYYIDQIYNRIIEDPEPPTPTEMLDELDTRMTRYDSQVSADNQKYYDTVKGLRNQAVSQQMTGQIKNSVGSDMLKDYIATDGIKSFL